MTSSGTSIGTCEILISSNTIGKILVHLMATSKFFFTDFTKNDAFDNHIQLKTRLAMTKKRTRLAMTKKKKSYFLVTFLGRPLAVSVDALVVTATGS